MKEKVRIGIIETGFARTVQILSFLHCPETEIVSIAGTKSNTRRRLRTVIKYKKFWMLHENPTKSARLLNYKFKKNKNS
jgi:hypothetical protein